ncbi:MAG: hypothetical protein EBQ66_02275 [Flavobacteriia bacterium]|nr:hypothetical protein [Flavobacteriia bacterium]
MNERIKELAEQVYGSAHYDDFKFAELLVREFAQLVEDNMDPQNAWITPGSVKQHFGVEE